jgi:hypothetical protein
MLRSRFMIALVLLLCAVLVVAAAGCSGSKSATTTGTESASAVEATAPPAPGVAIGKQIFLTGVGWNGQTILVSAPKSAQGALMMGGGGCAVCHASNGHGGTARTMTGTPIVAPNITYAVLKKAGFTDTTIRGAILWCTDEARQPLGEEMPCWQMGDVDVESTIAFMKTLK